MKSPGRAQEQEGDVGVLEGECGVLREECQALKEGNRKLSERLQQLQLQRAGSGEAYLAVTEDKMAESEDVGGGATETDSYISVATPRPGGRQVDASIQKNLSLEGRPGQISALREQLSQAEARALQVQSACEGLKVELGQMQCLYDTSRGERAQLERELQHCREELDQLMGGKAQTCTPLSESPVLSVPSVGMIVIVALIWCWCAELSS
ncbi:coiled-coil domain-containing protein 136-like isoform X1 [Conger conger]|uniref:coiled-coil domain-containing protein 136-like isoform X1 n=1 Tax=Conger conger TaxID=82655 RepID=UPI002A59EDB3|nr:coiled-coil domain-containing protein 136-like isoform X1 [Conger conger]